MSPTGSRLPTVRIAAGQGFWGDWLEAPYRQVTQGPVDYLMMDYLAEVTMSIMQKQKSRDPSLGYAKDFIPLMERILPTLVERRIKVTANAGGVNPRACAQAVAEAARRLRLGGSLKIGVVTGDDLLRRLDALLARGHELRNLDTGRPLSDVRDRVLSANAYLGAWPVAAALRQGADIVITGRVTDTGLTLAPMIHAFGWTREQAIAQLEEAGVPHVDAVIETDRYITLPGQALTYKIGQFEIEQHRADAAKRDGETFALTGFHDRLLTVGSLPLSALRRELAR